MNYDNRKFRLVENTGTGEVGGNTFFHYHQDGKIVWAEYSGGEIVKGNLIAMLATTARSICVITTLTRRAN